LSDGARPGRPHPILGGGYLGFGVELVSVASFFDAFFEAFLLAFFDDFFDDFFDIFDPEEFARGISPAVVGGFVVGGFVDVSLEPVWANAPKDARTKAESAAAMVRVIVNLLRVSDRGMPAGGRIVLIAATRVPAEPGRFSPFHRSFSPWRAER
jgi:hypothetical protein